MSAIEAQWPGKCAVCGEEIEPGHMIVFIDDQPCHEACEE